MRTATSSALLALLLAGCAAPERDGSVHLRGTINADMASKVTSSLAAGHRSFTIDSSGGFLAPAMTIALAVDKTPGVSITVSGRCESACVLVLAAARERFAEPGARVAFHAGGAGSVDALQAMWLQRRGVPADLLQDFDRNINSKPLSVADLRRMGVESR